MKTSFTQKKFFLKTAAVFIIATILLTAVSTSRALAYPMLPPLKQAGMFADIGTRPPTSAITASTNLTIPKPAGLASGDVLIVNITQRGNSADAPFSTGWNLITGRALRTVGQQVYGAVLYKVAGGSEPDDYTFTLGTGTNSAVGTIVAFSGVADTVFDVTPGSIQAGGATTAVAAPSITTVSKNSAVIMFGMADGTSAPPAPPTWSGWNTASLGALTELYDNQSAAASVGAAWAVMSDAGATGAGAATLSTAFRHGGILIALKPTKITPTVWLTGTEVTYNGSAQAPTFNSFVPGTFSLKTYNDSSTVPTDAGEYAVKADFTPDDSINYASLTNALVGTFTINQADATIDVTPYDVTYDGAAHTATGTATGVGAVDLSSLLDLSGTTHTDAGTYTGDPWSFDGGTNYKSASGTVDDSIAKANATIVVTPYSVTYDGNSHKATGTATGVGSVDLSGLLDLDGTAHTNAGSYVGDPWTFSGNTNYNYKSGTVNDNIDKADADIDVTPYSVPYDGIAHTADGTATGVGSVDLSSLLDLSGTTHTNAGTYDDDPWTFAGDTNYNSSNGMVDDSIAKVDADITVTPYDVTYNGEAHTAVGTAYGVEASPANLSSLLVLTGTTHTNAGTYTGDAWSFPGNTNYNPASGTVDDNIAKAEAVISVTPYSVDYDGLAHTATGTAFGVESSPANLGSLLDLSGTTHTAVGEYLADPWTFAGNANYNASDGTVHDSITKADQTISFSPLPDKKVSDPDFEISATATSGLPVTFSTDTTAVCTLTQVGEAWWVHLVAPGICSIKADQAGDASYNAAPQVVRSFGVSLHRLFMPIIFK